MNTKRIALIGDREKKSAFLEITGIDWLELEHLSSLANEVDLDAAFILLEEGECPKGLKGTYPLFIHSVSHTLSDLETGPFVYRINAWNGFVERPVWEICGNPSNDCQVILEHLGKKGIFVKDEPGMIAARVLAMIINEAYFALEGEVSSAPDIDLALRLGTNYPLGPVEWGKKIGLQSIFLLLKKLSEKNPIYMPSGLLEKESAL